MKALILFNIVYNWLCILFFKNEDCTHGSDMIEMDSTAEFFL